MFVACSKGNLWIFTIYFIHLQWVSNLVSAGWCNGSQSRVLATSYVSPEHDVCVSVAGWGPALLRESNPSPTGKKAIINGYKCPVKRSLDVTLVKIDTSFIGGAG